jgi:hypothetical protein
MAAPIFSAESGTKRACSIDEAGAPSHTGVRR